MNACLHTQRLRLEIARPGHERALARHYEENFEGHLARWSPPPPPEGLGVTAWAAKLPGFAREYDAGQSARWVLFEKTGDPEELVGTANVTQIARGPFQAAFLGYEVAARHEGRGYMTEALQAVVSHAFGELRLHRLMANVLPSNERSIRLLGRLGFDREGYAPDYLFIGGQWRDHILTSRLNPAFDPAWLVSPPAKSREAAP